MKLCFNLLILKIHFTFHLFIYLNTGEESMVNVTNHNMVGNLILLTGTFHEDNNFQWESQNLVIF